MTSAPALWNSLVDSVTPGLLGKVLFACPLAVIESRACRSFLTWTKHRRSRWGLSRTGKGFAAVRIFYAKATGFQTVLGAYQILSFNSAAMSQFLSLDQLFLAFVPVALILPPRVTTQLVTQNEPRFSVLEAAAR